MGIMYYILLVYLHHETKDDDVVVKGILAMVNWQWYIGIMYLHTSTYMFVPSSFREGACLHKRFLLDLTAFDRE